MNMPLKVLPLVALLAGCMESNNVAMDTGAGRTSDGQSTTGTVSTRTDGANVATVSLPGAVCTAVFTQRADQESTALNCTDGDSGTAIMRLTDSGSPRAVAYFRGLAGSGTVTF